jgi:aryl-alcohol dehydrogenase-like predicted oxidoreductase
MQKPHMLPTRTLGTQRLTVSAIGLGLMGMRARPMAPP